MLSENFSTNPESFIKFGRGRRVDLATSHGYTHNTMHSFHLYYDRNFQLKITNGKRKGTISLFHYTVQNVYINSLLNLHAEIS